jgi:hypothetical protein
MAITGTAAVNAPHSRRFAQHAEIRQSRSVWTAVALAPLFAPTTGVAQKLRRAASEIPI